MSKNKFNHKWDTPLKSFVDGATCLKCGMRANRMGILGLWYYNPKTGLKGYEYQKCIPNEENAVEASVATNLN